MQKFNEIFEFTKHLPFMINLSKFIQNLMKYKMN